MQGFGKPRSSLSENDPTQTDQRGNGETRILSLWVALNRKRVEDGLEIGNFRQQVNVEDW